MKRIAVACAMAVIAVAVQAQQSMGLVLSGGGAKGIAHIGVIKALEENDIPIDYVAGTSMGAIVGGLYAAGYTPEEMMALLESKDFSYWSTGVIDDKLTYYFDKSDPTPAFTTISFSSGDSVATSSILPSSLINPLPMNYAFLELFTKYTAQCGGNFDNLFVPYRCVASDVTHKHKVVCRSGDFGDAIHASMSFPAVYHPIEIDGVWLYDGGIYDNFPVDVMREDFSPDIMIGVDVSEVEPGPATNDIIDQLEEMIIQNNDYDLPADEGIKLHINLDKYNILDFPKAREIYRVGYDYAMSMMDSIKSRVTSRMPAQARELRRSVFKSKTPYVRFDSVEVSGGKDDQNDYIRYIFTKGCDDVFDLDYARDAYYRAVSTGKVRNLTPTAVYDPSDGMFTLKLKADIKDNYNIGVGGFVTSSTNSMIFLSAGYNTLSLNALDVNVNGWIGQSYLAGMLNAKYHLRTHRPSAVTLQGVLSRQKFYESENLFYEDDMPTFITTVDNFVRIGYSLSTSRNSLLELGAGFGYLSNRFYTTGMVEFAKAGRDYSRHTLGQVRAVYEYNTLDNQIYPSAGRGLKIAAFGVCGRYHFAPYAMPEREDNDNLGWGQFELNAQQYFPIGKFVLGAEINALYSTKKLRGDYTAAIVEASSFNPTPASYDAFNPAFRARSYMTAGLLPIWKLSDNMQLRGECHAFMPMRKILADENMSPYYGKWLSDPEFFGEVSVVYNLPFASLNVYGNYMSYPARNWNFGISFGLFFLAPKFLR